MHLSASSIQVLHLSEHGRHTSLKRESVIDSASAKSYWKYPSAQSTQEEASLQTRQVFGQAKQSPPS